MGSLPETDSSGGERWRLDRRVLGECVLPRTAISTFTAGDSADAFGSLTAQAEPPITSITFPSDTSAGGQAN